jgi:aminopeptidase N
VDHPYDKATSEFIVTAPLKYKVISNGLLQEESQINKDFKLTHWKQSVPVSCWLFVLGVAEFAVQYVDQFEGKSIESWVLPKDREAGFKDFANPTKQVLQFYSEYVGPYAYEKLANVQSPSVGGGMETASAIFYGEKLITGKGEARLRDVLVHEIAHQWFGNAVTESTWDDAWLSEGFATYFTQLFLGYAYGHEEYIAKLTRSRKTIFDFYKKDSTYCIVDDRTAEKNEQVTNVITYQKGAWVLHMLRERVGHDNFRKGIQAYYKKYMNANATTADFIAEMEKVSKQDLKTFFHQWLNKPDVLKISGRWTYDTKGKQIVINLSQTQSGLLFDTPIEFQVFEAGNTSPRLVKFDLNAKNVQYKIPCPTKPALVVIDPRTVLLADVDFKP